MPFICYNGIFLPADQPVLKADNRAYRYGDGFFETIKVMNGKIVLWSYHLQRIENSFRLLNYHSPISTIEKIIEEIFELCNMNHCIDAARIRLSFANGSGTMFDDNTVTDYIIEAMPLNNLIHFRHDDFTIGICPLAKKSCDAYANLKSANYLVSRIAIEYAKKHQWNDALILNQNDRIAESAIANIFWIKGGTVFTPPLSEGCVNGVMRNYLIDEFQSAGNPIVERLCTKSDLLNADEIFLTNAVKGISTIKNFEMKKYSYRKTKNIFDSYIAPLWME